MKVVRNIRRDPYGQRVGAVVRLGDQRIIIGPRHAPTVCRESEEWDARHITRADAAKIIRRWREEARGNL